MVNNKSLKFLVLFLLVIFISSCVQEDSPRAPINVDNRQWIDDGCRYGDWEDPEDYCKPGEMFQILVEDEGCSSHSECGQGEYCHSTGECVTYSDDYCINNDCFLGDGDCDPNQCNTGVCSQTLDNCNFGNGITNDADCCVSCLPTGNECNSDSECCNNNCNNNGFCAVGGGGGGEPDIPVSELLHSPGVGRNTKNDMNNRDFNWFLKKIRLREKESIFSYREDNMQCIPHPACSTCVDLHANNYDENIDLLSYGCDYYADERDLSIRTDSFCKRTFHFSTGPFFLSEGNGACESEQHPGEGCSAVGEGYAVSNVAYTRQFDGSDWISNENLCISEGDNCCILPGTDAYNPFGILSLDDASDPNAYLEGWACCELNEDLSNDPNWGSNSLSFFRYCGDNLCQGWLDSQNPSQVCRGPNNDFPSSYPGSVDCIPDPDWENEYRETYESCVYNTNEQEFRDCADCVWVDENGDHNYDCDPVTETIYFDCRTDTSCDSGEQEISGFYLSNPTNGHVSTSYSSDYDWRICCNPEQFTVSTESETQFLSLSSNDNAHVAQPDTSGYTNYGISDLSSCNIVSGGCSEEQFCVLSMSSLNNAHAASCNQENYPYKVCCS